MKNVSVKWLFKVHINTNHNMSCNSVSCLEAERLGDSSYSEFCTIVGLLLLLLSICMLLCICTHNILCISSSYFRLFNFWLLSSLKQPNENFSGFPRSFPPRKSHVIASQLVINPNNSNNSINNAAVLVVTGGLYGSHCAYLKAVKLALP